MLRTIQFPAFMGIVNVTDDSFSDGGLFSDTDSAVRHAQGLLARGAAVIDIGGESTRPGFAPIAPDEELRRVIPVIRHLASESQAFLSVDTTKAVVASNALDAGASMVNDISGGTFDSEMIAVTVKKNAAVCLGHVFGDKQSMHDFSATDDIVRDVTEFLASRRDAFLAAGMKRENIFLDPGIGFGKTPEQNFTLLENIQALQSLGCRLVVGVSRKRFLGGETLGEKDRKTAEWTKRLFAAGVDLVRVHRVG